MAKQFFNKKPGVHSSSMALAVATKEEALRRNEQFREQGIAAEHPIREDGQVMPLEFRDRNGRKQAYRALGVFDQDAGYSDAQDS
jgi:hypothetical protein